MLTPPYHYCIAQCPPAQQSTSTSREILYRGAQPAHRNLPFIARLSIKTIVLLRKTPLPDDDPLAIWASNRGVEVRWIKADEMNEEKLGLGKNEIGQVLKVILDTTLYPLYIADADGISHTTLAVACLRKLQGWHMDCIINEISRFQPDLEDFPIIPFISTYLSPGTSSSVQPEAPLTLPSPPYPAWLWPSSSSPSRPQAKENTRDRAASTPFPVPTFHPLCFPHPLAARKHPTMRLTFPALPQQQSSAPQTTAASPIINPDTGLARVPSRRDKVVSPPPVSASAAPPLHLPPPPPQPSTEESASPFSVPVPKRDNSGTPAPFLGSPDEGALGHLIHAGLAGIASVLSAVSPPPPAPPVSVTPSLRDTEQPAKALDDTPGAGVGVGASQQKWEERSQQESVSSRASRSASRSQSPRRQLYRELDSADDGSSSTTTGLTEELSGQSMSVDNEDEEDDYEEDDYEEDEDEDEDEEDEDEEDEDEDEDEDIQTTSQYISALDLAGL